MQEESRVIALVSAECFMVLACYPCSMAHRSFQSPAKRSAASKPPQLDRFVERVESVRLLCWCLLVCLAEKGQEMACFYVGKAQNLSLIAKSDTPDYVVTHLLLAGYQKSRFTFSAIRHAGPSQKMEAATWYRPHVYSLV